MRCRVVDRNSNLVWTLKLKLKSMNPCLREEKEIRFKTTFLLRIRYMDRSSNSIWMLKIKLRLMKPT
jgi:hypothetical protein